MDKAVEPRIYKPRPVPYALRDKVEQELERLQRNAWCHRASEILEMRRSCGTVVKADQSLRIHVYVGIINLLHAATVDSYPLPRIDDVLASMTGAKVHVL